MQFSHPSNPRYLLVSFGVIAVLALGALLSIHASNEQDRQLDAFKQRLQTEARLFAEHAELSIAAADLVLSSIATDIYRSGLENFAQDPARWDSVRRTLEQSPQLLSLMVMDADGKVRLTTTSYPVPPGMTASDREYFQANRQGQSHHVGRPLIGRGSGKRLIPISVRLTDPTGGFAGAAVAALDANYFQAFYTSEPAEMDRHITMYRSDGVLLSQYPAPAENGPGKPLPDLAAQLGEQRAASHVGPALQNGRKSIIAYRRVDHYPVVISVSVDHAIFGATVNRIWARNLTAFLAFALGTGIAIWLLDRSMREAARAREAQLVLARKTRGAERLALAVTRNIPNGWVAIVDRELRYIFMEGVTSLRPAIRSRNSEAIGKTIREFYPSETSATLENLVLKAFQGKASQHELAFGKTIARFNVVPLGNDEQQINHVLLLAHDITELKHTQLELEERNRQLQAYSFTDGLLGIANRRLFDQQYAREWRRALRDQQPLALLMIDVDYFKFFNDRYGHMAGDECLRGIAALLSEAVSRPGDMVARYGGEEFAVLLPMSDLAGALHLSEQIHVQLARKAIPFPDSPAGATVTVCIGAAAILPQPELSPQALIEEADAALYVAKREGRNRTATVEKPHPDTKQPSRA